MPYLFEWMCLLIRPDHDSGREKHSISKDRHHFRLYGIIFYKSSKERRYIVRSLIYYCMGVSLLIKD